jgi:hypothetical protein
MIVENIESTFDFGKYKGEVLKDVALNDPSYIEWLCKTVLSFVISNETIDSLSDYCLSVFFNNPEKYLNEEGNFTRCRWQHLKYKGQELTIGSLNSDEFTLNALKERSKLDEKWLKVLEQKNFQSKGKHISVASSRAVFNAEVCKQNLIARKIAP